MDLGSIIAYVVTFFSLFTAMFFFITLIENKKNIKSPKAKNFPSITVGVPAYNEENTLAGTVESLLNIDYPKDKIQIYIVNDGSKDNTSKIADSFKKYGVKVIHKQNSGKADSLNQILRVCKTELFASLDADSFADKNSLKRMVGFFEDPKIMAVTPSMMVHDPKNIWQKVQYIEYLIGVFLRKCFAFLGAIHVTPGPLSVYRKSFFDKYGGYALNNMTEDIEVALRIQKEGYQIENAVDAYVTTVSPNRFNPLKLQRKRWYSGFILNVLDYRELFTKKGNLGRFILPASLFSVLLVIIAAGYAAVNFVIEQVQRYSELKAINFEFWRMFGFNWDIFFWNFDALFFLSVLSLIAGISIITIAKKLAQRKESIALSYVYFFFIYWFLFAFWWIISGVSVVVKHKVKWGETDYEG